jgi:hypothetical protein
VVRNGVAAWAHKLSYPGRLDVLVADLAKGSKRVLLSNVNVGQVALAGPRLVYALTGYAAGVYTNTMMSMPLAGGTSTRVSSSEHVQGPVADGNLVARQEPDSGQPQLLKTRVLPNGIETVAIAGSNHGNVSVGSNFLVFAGIDGQWYVTRPNGGVPVRLSTNSWYTSGLSILGNQGAWGDEPDGTTVRVFTATVG